MVLTHHFTECAKPIFFHYLVKSDKIGEDNLVKLKSPEMWVCYSTYFIALKCYPILFYNKVLSDSNSNRSLLFQSTCWCVFGQNAEPQIPPNDCSISVCTMMPVNVWVCVCVYEPPIIKRFEWSPRLEKCYINAVHLPFIYLLASAPQHCVSVDLLWTCTAWQWCSLQEVYIWVGWEQSFLCLAGCYSSLLKCKWGAIFK